MDIQRFLIISILSIVGPIGVILNAIIIVTLVKNRLFTTRSYLIYANLAVCDVINATFACAFGLAVYSSGEFVFCKSILVVTVLAYTTSVSVVTVLSFDRYLMLRSPMQYVRIMTSRCTVALLTTIWAVSILNAGLLLSREAILPITGRISLLNRKNCVLSRLIVRKYLLIWIFLLIILPMLATVVINIVILRIATKHYKHLNRRTITSRQQEQSASSSPVRDWNVKAALTTVRIVATNVICTLPFVCVLLVDSVSAYSISYKTIKPFYTLFLLNFCSTTVNPLVYTLTNKDLKRRVRSLLRDICCPCISRCFTTSNDTNDGDATAMSVTVRPSGRQSAT